MYALLSDLKTQFTRQEIIIDNVLFRIHCTFTTVMLITFSLIVTWTQFVGQPIRCMPEKDGIPQHMLNLYCWVTPTFTVPDLLDRPSYSQNAFPGIGASRYNHDDYSSQHKYYSYYQWVSFVLLFQALLFYLPKWIWLNFEKGFMKTLVEGLQLGLRSAEGDHNDRKDILAKYLCHHKDQFKWYAYRYWFCELLCLVNVFLQMFLTNWFFNGDFISYGINILNLDSKNLDDRTDYMVQVFPRMTKCTFKKFGGSGDVQIFDALCLLPLNIVNEKTYIFLWFWFIVLGSMLIMLIVYRLLIVFVASVRCNVMKARYRMIEDKDIELVSRSKVVSRSQWWILNMLGRNMDSYLYNLVVKDFAKSLKVN